MKKSHAPFVVTHFWLFTLVSAVIFVLLPRYTWQFFNSSAYLGNGSDFAGVYYFFFYGLLIILSLIAAVIRITQGVTSSNLIRSKNRLINFFLKSANRLLWRVNEKESAATLVFQILLCLVWNVSLNDGFPEHVVSYWRLGGNVFAFVILVIIYSVSFWLTSILFGILLSRIYTYIFPS